MLLITIYNVPIELLSILFNMIDLISFLGGDSMGNISAIKLVLGAYEVSLDAI